MNAINIIKYSYTILQKKYRLSNIKKAYNMYKLFIRRNGKNIIRLSTEQKAEVDKLYKGYGWKYSYDTHELVLTVTGEFNAAIFPEDLFRSTVEYSLNNQSMRAGWDDKNYFDLYLGKKVFPASLVRNINGVFYDADYKLISINNAIDKCIAAKTFVIKPSTETGFGRNVAKISVDNQCDVRSIFDKYKKDYIVQELVDMHDIIKFMNPDSVSVMRVISLFINGKATVLSATFRIGTGNDFKEMQQTDDGEGFVIVGVDMESGRIKQNGYFQSGKPCTCLPNGYDFRGVQIPNWNILLDTISSLHEKMAHFGFIGWDVTIDHNEMPVIIEYNCSGPGVLYYQYCNGPLLGDRTIEVLDYIKKNRQT